MSRRTLWFGLALDAGAVAGYAWWTRERLREYLTWEQNPVLQRRARRLLARFENALA